jgi:peptide deformylase
MLRKPQILKLALMGEDVLKKKAEAVDLNNLREIADIVEDMKYTLIAQGERVGLAAPQVFISKRLLIFRIPQHLHSRYVNQQDITPMDLHPLINPEIEFLNDEQEEGYEACISIPGLMGIVPRYKNIRYSYYDLKGEKHTVDASGFHARVVQHEYDHLDGILYPERMKDLSTLGFEEIIQNPSKNL